jgi:FtsP/CotA-like multicopper oxidase with cupredoxin domain
MSDPTNDTRRNFLIRSSAAAIAAAAARSSALAAARPAPALGAARAPALPGIDYAPVHTPNGVALEFRIVDGVKVFHLVAQEVLHEFAPGLQAHCWGYNGRVHGPTIEAVQGERVRIYLTNRLQVPTTVHWHGLWLPAGMDGVGGLTQRPVLPGETFRYEFPLLQHGTFMYHAHHDEMAQMALGLMGLFVIHPRESSAVRAARDYAYLLSEWKIEPGTRRPDPNEMTDFNVLTFNAKIAPATEPLLARTGERVRIRIGNLSAMDHHPIHLHGHSFEVTETDGGVIPEAGRWPEVSVLVPVGSTRTIEFEARAAGDWALHCHMTHHVMNQMGHGLPNLVGVDPSAFDERLSEVVPLFGAMDPSAGAGAHALVPENSLPMIGQRGPFGHITMSGMFSVLKVRDELESDSAAGWYAHPPEQLARPARPDELAADGIQT